MASEFTGRILHVGLSTGTVETEAPPESFYRTYLGGSAMGLHYILQEVPAGTDGLDPANVLTWMDSLLTGTPIAGQSRITINARSPLTDGIGDSQGGGFFPAELRFAGFTGIVVRGRAPEPVYLWIHDGEAELRPAGHLWGKTTTETVDALKVELGDEKIEVAAIGPSGEKAVLLSAIISMGNRANGRTGMGAVMEGADGRRRGPGPARAVGCRRDPEQR
jgi:aldehyde:ferredoxin oxidoreductase